MCRNVTNWTEDPWKPHIQLTRRSAFRIHKSDLSIRPLWHQQTDRMLARILVCFLAYALMRRRGVPYSSYARMNPP